MVWSAESGYPGSPEYREFHRDLGHERDLRPFFDIGTADGRGWPSGIKYYAVTDRGSDRKDRYDPERASDPRAARNRVRGSVRWERGCARRHTGDRSVVRGALRRRALRTLVVRGAHLPGVMRH